MSGAYPPAPRRGRILRPRGRAPAIRASACAAWCSRAIRSIGPGSRGGSRDEA